MTAAAQRPPLLLRPLLLLLLVSCRASTPDETGFEGKFFSGGGNATFVEALDNAARMFAPDPAFASVQLLYNGAWDGVTEGQAWHGWWSQNSYGPHMAAMPFASPLLFRWMENSLQWLWATMSDGTAGPIPGAGTYAPAGLMGDYVAGSTPPGAFWPGGPCSVNGSRGTFLHGCSPVMYKQGDGSQLVQDWSLGESLGAVITQAELLLVSRDIVKIKAHLPKFLLASNLMESRRDTSNNLFLSGAGSNLLAPSYGAWLQDDGTIAQAYMAELSVSYTAALNRIVELEKLVDPTGPRVAVYEERLLLNHRGIAAHFWAPGNLSRSSVSVSAPGVGVGEARYFVRQLDPNGTVHGLIGAARHGYFEATPNHDAMAWRIVPVRVDTYRILTKSSSPSTFRRLSLHF
jgi:hypothetical protein